MGVDIYGDLYLLFVVFGNTLISRMTTQTSIVT